MWVNINHFAFSGANMEQPTGTTADMFTRSAPWNAVSGRQQRQEDPHQAAVSSLKHVFSPRPIRGFFVSPPRNFLAAFQRQHVFVQSIGTPTQRLAAHGGTEHLVSHRAVWDMLKAEPFRKKVKNHLNSEWQDPMVFCSAPSHALPQASASY